MTKKQIQKLYGSLIDANIANVDFFVVDMKGRKRHSVFDFFMNGDESIDIIIRPVYAKSKKKAANASASL